MMGVAQVLGRDRVRDRVRLPGGRAAGHPGHAAQEHGGHRRHGQGVSPAVREGKCFSGNFGHLQDLTVTAISQIWPIFSSLLVHFCFFLLSP